MSYLEELSDYTAAYMKTEVVLNKYTYLPDQYEDNLLPEELFVDFAGEWVPYNTALTKYIVNFKIEPIEVTSLDLFFNLGVFYDIYNYYSVDIDPDAPKVSLYSFQFYVDISFKYLL